MLITAIAIGLVYGFLLFEATGLVAGGLIAPGYLALALDQPWLIGLCLLVAGATMLIVRLLSSVALIYGRRRFLLCVLIGFVVQWAVAAAVMRTPFGLGRVNVIGYIIPGLLANEMARQGTGRTLLALLLLTCLVWLTLTGLKAAGWL